MACFRVPPVLHHQGDFCGKAKGILDVTLVLKPCFACLVAGHAPPPLPTGSAAGMSGSASARGDNAGQRSRVDVGRGEFLESDQITFTHALRQKYDPALRCGERMTDSYAMMPAFFAR